MTLVLFARLSSEHCAGV